MSDDDTLDEEKQAERVVTLDGRKRPCTGFCTAIKEALIGRLRHVKRQLLAERASNTRKGFQMPTRTETLQGVVKMHGGLVGLCKHICKHGSDISEHELTALIVAEAKRATPELSDAAAFTKVFTDASSVGELYRRAVGVTKGYPISSDEDDVGVVGGGEALDTQGEDESDIDALTALGEKAQELMAENPGMSFAQAFAAVYRDNPNLAKAERRTSMRKLYGMS